MADPKFEPCWLYGPNREAVEIFTQADYDKFAALGWQGSPAAFGIETHPQHPIQVVGVTSIDAGQPPSPSMTQLHTQLTQVEGEMVTLQAQLESVTNRLGALEAHVTSPLTRSTPASGPPPETKPSDEETTSSPGRGSSRSPDVTSPHDDPGSSAGRRRP